MNKKIIAAIAIAGIVAVPASMYVGLQMNSASAEASAKAEKVDKKSAKAPTHHYMKFKQGFLIKLVNDQGRDKWLSFKIRLRSDGKFKNAEAKKPVVRHEIITRLYDLDGNFTLDNEEAVQRIQSSVRNAVDEVMGEDKVDKVLFDNLVQQSA